MADLIDQDRLIPLKIGKRKQRGLDLACAIGVDGARYIPRLGTR